MELDPEEEFQLMHADEMELLDDFEDYLPVDPVVRPASVPKKRLNFDESANTNSGSCVSAEKSLSAKETNASTSNSRLEPNKKRPVEEDLFGDITDIDWEEESRPSYKANEFKRSRLEYEVPRTANFFEHQEAENQEYDDQETSTINRIKFLRDLANIQHEKNHSSALGLQSSSNEECITKGVPKWPFVSVTSQLGQRVYIRVRSEEYFEKECHKMSRKEQHSNLLLTSFSSIKEEALQLLEKQELEKTLKISELPTSSSEADVGDASVGASSDLWVEVYKPKSYSELLSDESVNRTLLHWLKLWDKVVFNREWKGRLKPKKDKNEKFQKKSFGQIMSDELDEHGRPEHKIVLLCGPPGLGKTTLAHVVAKLAGYNVVEVNASDDRSPEAFRIQLEASTKMKSVMGADPRPNCLVLDEIDGAPATSIETLVKFVIGKDVGKGKGKKKGASAGILKRPIICICNDAYVPALRMLRQHAFIIHFPQTGSDRLATRLAEIARKEHLKTSIGAMLALCERTQNDVRSCLSCLHYFKSQKHQIQLSDIRNAAVGQKDVQKGLFSVWQEIFQIKRSKGAFTQAALNDTDKMADHKASNLKGFNAVLLAGAQSVLHTVQSYGDYERLAQGVFENYPSMKLKDSSLNGIVKALDWFCYMDELNREIHTTQSYILMSYLPYGFVVWHVVFASLTWTKLKYPNLEYEASVKGNHIKDVVGQVIKGMQPGVRSNCNISTLVLDTLPLLSEIIVPNLRPVSLELFNTKEREDLCNVVKIMIDYSLTYIQERSVEGAFVCVLDPNVEEVVHFSTSKPSRSLTYRAKHLISREIDIEKMRQNESVAPVNVPSTKQQSFAKPESKIPEKKLSPSVPNHLQKLKPKPVLKETQTKDFFGRVVTTPVSSKTLTTTQEEDLDGDVWFHFKEGFNNAVRKNVRMADLL